MTEDVVLKSKMIIAALKKYGEVNFRALGRSMQPIINDGDTVTVVSINRRKLKFGQIVCFQNAKNDIVLHKLIFDGGDKIFTWGVNNRFLDEPVCKINLLGYVDSISVNESLVNRLYESEFNGIKKLLRDENLHILKGSLWFKKRFGYHPNKQSSDLDLLIDIKDFEPIKNRLLTNGFFQVTSEDIEGVEKTEVTFSKAYPGFYLVLDLHRSPLTVNWTRFFNYKERLEIIPQFNMYLQKHKTKIGFKITMFDDTTQLLYQCMNMFFHHGVKGVMQLSVIAKIVQDGKVNWTEFWFIANRYKVNNYIYFPLSLVNRLFGLNIPFFFENRPRIWARIAMRLFVNRFTVFDFSGGPNKWKAMIHNKLISLMAIMVQI